MDPAEALLECSTTTTRLVTRTATADSLSATTERSSPLREKPRKHREHQPDKALQETTRSEIGRGHRSGWCLAPSCNSKLLALAATISCLLLVALPVATSSSSSPSSLEYNNRATSYNNGSKLHSQQQQQPNCSHQFSHQPQSRSSHYQSITATGQRPRRPATTKTGARKPDPAKHPAASAPLDHHSSTPASRVAGKRQRHDHTTAGCHDCLAIPLLTVTGGGGGHEDSDTRLRPEQYGADNGFLIQPLEPQPQQPPMQLGGYELLQQPHSQLDRRPVGGYSQAGGHGYGYEAPAQSLELKSDEHCPMTGPLTVCDRIGSYPADTILYKLVNAKRALKHQPGAAFNLDSLFSDERDHSSEPFEPAPALVSGARHWARGTREPDAELGIQHNASPTNQGGLKLDYVLSPPSSSERASYNKAATDNNNNNNNNLLDSHKLFGPQLAPPIHSPAPAAAALNRSTGSTHFRRRQSAVDEFVELVERRAIVAPLSRASDLASSATNHRGQLHQRHSRAPKLPPAALLTSAASYAASGNTDNNLNIHHDATHSESVSSQQRQQPVPRRLRRQSGLQVAPLEASAQPEQTEPVCRARSIYISPRAALNDKKQWKYVVNAPERDPQVRQIIRVDICENPFGSCSDQLSLPFGYSSQCKQKYAKKKLLALDSQSGLLEVDTFFIPSCCVCQLVRAVQPPTDQEDTFGTSEDSRPSGARDSSSPPAAETLDPPASNGDGGAGGSSPADGEDVDADGSSGPQTAAGAASPG